MELEVARDRGFRRVVARKLIPTSGRIDHAVKARVGGLRAHEQYYYRFSTRGEDSPVGRFRTALPPDSRQPVKFAFFSCQDYTFGFYNAHLLLAREDVDFVINLGDYIYAEAYHARGGPTAGARTDPIGEATTLADYRAKYALYRSDSALRRMHQQFPMISIWDDHEVVDNYAGGVAGGGLSPDKRYTEARKEAGYRAYFENMPTFPQGNRRGKRTYGARRYGRNVDLVLLDQRQYRADQPCGDKQVGPALPRAAQLTAVPGPRADEVRQDPAASAPRPRGRSWPTRRWSCAPSTRAATTSASTRGRAIRASAPSCCGTCAPGTSTAWCS